MDQLGPPLPASPPSSTCQRVVTRHRDAILASIEHGLSNARIESVNTKIRLITRIAFGFHSAEALIALAMLTSADTDPHSPAR